MAGRFIYNYHRVISIFLQRAAAKAASKATTKAAAKASNKVTTKAAAAKVARMNGQQDNVRTQILGFACLLFALWVLLSGRLEVRFLVIGFFSALVIAILCFPLLIVKNPRTEQEYFALGLHFFKMIPYGLWLIKEIFKSTLDVTREIFHAF